MERNGFVWSVEVQCSGVEWSGVKWSGLEKNIIGGSAVE